MEQLGFQVKSFGNANDDDYVKPPVSNIEMHRALFSDLHDRKLYEYYRDIRNRLIKDEDNHYGYHFRADDFYIFIIAHECKHYYMGGTGLRSLLDTYIILQKKQLDMRYVETETEKLGVADFERLNRSLSLKLFSYRTRKELELIDVSLTAEEQQMLNYILSSGTYGTLDHRIENEVNKSGGKLQYLIKRIFGPLGKNDPFREHFKQRYAVFFKYPLLLPILPFYRLFKALHSSPKRIVAETSALKKTKAGR